MVLGAAVSMNKRRIVFLQGPPSPFYTRIGCQMVALGHDVTAINLSLGDRLFWRGPNPVNYQGSFAEWAGYISNFLDENKITDIILHGEQRPYHQHAVEAAKLQNVQVIATDFGYLRPDWIVFEKEGMNGNSKFPRDPIQIRALAAEVQDIDFEPKYRDNFWTMAGGDMLYHFSNLFLCWLSPNYRPYQRDNPLLLYPGTGIRLLMSGRSAKKAQRQFATLCSSGARYYVFPLQIENDFQITAYSPFGSLEEAIRKVIKSFAENATPETRLLVKVHPWDPGLKSWRKVVQRLGVEFAVIDRISYYDGGNLDEMIRGAAGVVTVNSTSGLRALQLGCPVKLLGEAIFDIAGLTDPGELDQFWHHPDLPDVELTSAFIKAIAATLHIRGGYFSEPGLSAAVNTAVERLSQGKMNQLM